MRDDGQMIILSAMVACLCLMGVVACVSAVDDGAHTDHGLLSSVMLDNVRWAQDNGMQKAAFYYSTYPWDSRGQAATMFKSEFNTTIDSLSLALLKRGLTYGFTYNSSLGDEYMVGHPGAENVGGVIVEPAGSEAKIVGCAYDVTVDDGHTAYHISRVVIFN